MSNNNKKIVLNAEKKLRKKVIKKYRKENRYDFIFLLILQCYVLTLFILSIATDSSFLSLILAIFSLITTFSFEALEWIDFKSKSVSSCLINYILKNKAIIMLLIPVFFLITMIPLFIWNKLDANSYIQITQTIDPHIPNIITAITFALYFTSFYIRNYYKKREAFITSFNVSAKYCYAAHESRLHQNDRCKRFTLCLVLTVHFRSLAPWGKLFQLFI